MTDVSPPLEETSGQFAFEKTAVKTVAGEIRSACRELGTGIPREAR